MCENNVESAWMSLERTTRSSNGSFALLRLGKKVQKNGTYSNCVDEEYKHEKQRAYPVKYDVV